MALFVFGLPMDRFLCAYVIKELFQVYAHWIFLGPYSEFISTVRWLGKALKDIIFVKYKAAHNRSC